MRDNKEAAQEVLRRSAGLRAQNAKRKNKIYAITSVVACLALVVGLAVALPSIVAEAPPEAAGLYSATLLADSGVGGYVLIGVVGLALGGVATLLCVKFLTRNKNRDG